MCLGTKDKDFSTAMRIAMITYYTVILNFVYLYSINSLNSYSKLNFV